MASGSASDERLRKRLNRLSCRLLNLITRIKFCGSLSHYPVSESTNLLRGERRSRRASALVASPMSYCCAGSSCRSKVIRTSCANEVASSLSMTLAR